MTRKSAVFITLAAVLGAWILMTIGVIGRASSLKASSYRALLVPDQFTDQISGAPLTQVLGLKKDALYLLRTELSSRAVDLNGMADAIELVGLSARGDLIAIRLAGDLKTRKPYPRNNRAVAVLDTSASELTVIPFGARFAWSPEGSRLAVVCAHVGLDELEHPDSVGIWNADTREISFYPLSPYDVAWRDNSRLILDYGGRCDLWEVGGGPPSRSRNAGTAISPDSSYSVSNFQEDTPRIWDDISHKDITKRVLAAVDGERLDRMAPPFWLPSGEGPHLLCVPSCKNPSTKNPTGSPKCSVYVLDVETNTAVRKIEGQAVAKSTDGLAVAVLRGSQLRMVDLRGP